MWRGKFTVLADISECYGSIYTHSLEWALHTKAIAKANLTKGKSKLLGGKLDAAVRNGQDGQTKGIPVGPDTSLLLAEIILCAVDVELQNLMPQVTTSAIRLMDDLEFFARSRAEAEDFITAWDSRLHVYGLALNPRKTAIVEGVVPHAPSWRIQLSQFNFRPRGDTLLANDISSFFAQAFKLARENPGKAVLSYAIQRVSRLDMGEESWQVFQAAMLAAITAEPSSLRFVGPIVIRADRSGLMIDRTLFGDVLNELCLHHAPFEHGSEVSWSLYILKALGISLDSGAASRVASMQDNCSLLLLLDFVTSLSISGPAPDTGPIRERAEDPSAPFSEDWLLGYEMCRNGWSKSTQFPKEKHWAELLDAKVVFYNSQSSKERRFVNSVLPSQSVRDDFFDLY